MIDIRVYTIGDLKNWVMHNEKNGLSESVISRSRAFAMIHNPYAQDDQPALSVAFDDGKMVGYTAGFAEDIGWNGELYYWGSTLYVNPECRGKGIGKKVLGTYKESVGNKYVAIDSSDASIAIDEKTGSYMEYFNRYYLLFGNVSSALLKLYSKAIVVRNKKVFKDVNLDVRKVSFIDDEIFLFIQQHNGKDLLYRSQDMLNWILHYPFVIETYTQERSDYDFACFAKRYKIEAFAIYCEGNLVGVYICRISDERMTLLYMYCEEDYRKEIYRCVLNYMVKNDISRFDTFDKGIIDAFDEQKGMSTNRRSRIVQVAMTVPNGMVVDKGKIVHGGDADMFV